MTKDDDSADNKALKVDGKLIRYIGVSSFYKICFSVNMGCALSKKLISLHAVQPQLKVKTATLASATQRKKQIQSETLDESTLQKMVKKTAIELLKSSLKKMDRNLHCHTVGSRR